MPSPDRLRTAAMPKVPEPLAWLRDEIQRLADGQASLLEGQVKMQDMLAKMAEASPKLPAGSGIPIAEDWLLCHSSMLAENGSAGREMQKEEKAETANASEAVGSEVKAKHVKLDVPDKDLGHEHDLDAEARRRVRDMRKSASLDLIIKAAEIAEQEEEEENAIEANSLQGYINQRLSRMSMEEREDLMDMITGGIICVNAILIGVQMDQPQPKGLWVFLDIVFSTIFVSELWYKVRMHGGFRGQFWNHARAFGNIFDAFLISLDLIQLVIEISAPEGSLLTSAPSASLFRIVRLARLGRLVRAMKSAMFRSLAEMLHGIAAGMSTLAWSFVLFFMCVYICALVLREGLGADTRDVEHVTRMFDTVPRSMLTIFRCSFGDCSSEFGSPIFEHVMVPFGASPVLFYTGMTFVVHMVVFNVISAMFVEKTMFAAKSLAEERKRERMQDKHLLAANVAFLIRMILHNSPDHDVPEHLSGSLEELIHAEVPLWVVDQTIKDPAVKKALNELDINPHDHARLSDIFDPDNGGTVDLADVATGLRSLRGDPRRSDIVTVDLMIRSMQAVLHDVLDHVKNIEERQKASSPLGLIRRMKTA